MIKYLYYLIEKLKSKGVHMNQKGYKKLICCLLVVMTACSAGGCAKSKFPVLTEEEENLYADYAANLVLKYDKNYIDRMKSVELETEEETEATTQTGGTEESQAVAEMSMNDLLGLQGVQIQPAGYEVASSYPSDSGELGMSMTSVKGCKLLVVKFSVTNTSGSDVNVSMIDKTIQYRGVLNGTVKVNAQVTALLNALNTYQGTIPAGGTEELVLVFQINEHDAENIQSLELNVTYNNQQGKIVIQ